MTPFSPLTDAAVTRLQRGCERPDLESSRYRLGPELGRGGMGVVYQAYDQELAREVALKVVFMVDADRAEVLAHLRREARTLASLEHPGIVPIYDVGSLPDGRIFYTMRLVRGQRLDRYCGVGHEHSIPERLRLFVRICETIAFAHAHGIVHRDLKPANIMLGPFGEVLVLDWGLAQTMADGAAPLVGAGTPGYMSPEQTAGHAQEMDGRSDIFALGMVLRQILENEHDAIPKPLMAISARATATDPQLRYATALALAGDVLRYVDGESVGAYRESFGERMSRSVRRHRVLLGLALTYLVVRAVLFFILTR